MPDATQARPVGAGRGLGRRRARWRVIEKRSTPIGGRVEGPFRPSRHPRAEWASRDDQSLLVQIEAGYNVSWISVRPAVNLSVYLGTALPIPTF